MPQKNIDCQLQAKKLAIYQTLTFKYTDDQLQQISKYCSTKLQYRRVLINISQQLKKRDLDKRLKMLVKGVSVVDNQPINNPQNKNNFGQLEAQNLAKQHTFVSDYNKDELKQILQFCKGKNEYRKVINKLRDGIKKFELERNLNQVADSFQGIDTQETKNSECINIDQQFPKSTSAWFSKLPQFVKKIFPHQLSRSSQYQALSHQD